MNEINSAKELNEKIKISTLNMIEVIIYNLF